MPHGLIHKLLPIVACLGVALFTIDMNIFRDPYAYSTHDFKISGFIFLPAIAVAFYTFFLADRPAKTKLALSDGPRKAGDDPKRPKTGRFWGYVYGVVVILAAFVYTTFFMTGA